MKKALICSLILISSLALFGCGGEKADPAPQKAASGKTITIGVMPDVESIPFIIAERNGYFEKEGVKVKLEHFKSAQDRESALQSGKLDGVITDIIAVVFANEGGLALQIISKNDGDIIMMAGKDTGISSINGLKGKKVGLSTNTIMEYSVDQMLLAAQMKPEEIEKVAIPPLPTRLEMLQGRKIEGAILPEPLAGLAVKNGAIILNSTYRMGNKAGAIAFTAQSLQESPEEIKAVFRAYNEAVNYLQKEPLDSYSDFIIEKQGFPAAIKDSLLLPEYSKAEAPQEQIVSDVVQWMKSKGLIEGDYKYEDLVNQNILRQ